jgi:hypothetical protein
LATNSMMRSSSTFVHAPFTKSGFKTFCHRWRHCTSVLSVKNSAAHHSISQTMLLKQQLQ